LVIPGATVTEAGTLATDALPLRRVTTAPEGGAAPVRVTVPWEGLPPLTLGGLRVREDNTITGAGGVPVTLRIALLLKNL